jgi:hypothetical protein
VLVCGEVDFGAMVAAEHAGLPFAPVLISATEMFVRPEVVAEPIAALRAEHGLPAEEPQQRLVLSPFPHRLRRLPLGAYAFRQAVASGPADDANAVYLTLGTIFNLESGDLFERALAGLRELPVDVIATTGANLDPAQLGPQPPNVRVERYLPQSDVLPRCRAVVSHAGSGSVLGALAHGLPSVLLPMGADQPQNAERCAELGVARVLDASRATPDAVRDAGADIFTTPSYRAAARQIAAEIAALPGPASAVTELARLGALSATKSRSRDLRRVRRSRSHRFWDHLIVARCGWRTKPTSGRCCARATRSARTSTKASPTTSSPPPTSASRSRSSAVARASTSRSPAASCSTGWRGWRDLRALLHSACRRRVARSRRSAFLTRTAPR